MTRPAPRLLICLGLGCMLAAGAVAGATEPPPRDSQAAAAAVLKGAEAERARLMVLQSTLERFLAGEAARGEALRAQLQALSGLAQVLMSPDAAAWERARAAWQAGNPARLANDWDATAAAYQKAAGKPAPEAGALRDALARLRRDAGLLDKTLPGKFIQADWEKRRDKWFDALRAQRDSLAPVAAAAGRLDRALAAERAVLAGKLAALDQLRAMLAPPRAPDAAGKPGGAP